MDWGQSNELARRLTKSTSRRSVLRGIVGGAIGGLATIVGVSCRPGDDTRGDDSAREIDAESSREWLEALAAVVADTLTRGDAIGGGEQSLPEDYDGPVYVALRTGGERIGSGWALATSSAGSVVAAVREADKNRQAQSRPNPDTVDM